MTGPSGAAETAMVNPVIGAVLGLGWRMEELFNRCPIPEGPPHGYDAGRLPGLSRLTSYDRQRLGLDQVDFVLSQVTAKVGTPAAVPLDLTVDARKNLDATTTKGGAAVAHDEYKMALGQLHVNLLVTTSAAGSFYGKAYGLGRALADTTRPHQSLEELVNNFQRYRVNQLYVWLDELASLFPQHAARSVATSLGWWQQVVSASHARSTLSSATAPTNPLVLNTAAKPSKWRRAAAALGPQRTHRDREVVPPDLTSLTAAVSRQGGLWREVLAGEKLGLDLLTPDDYLRAGERLADHFADLVRQAWPTLAPWLATIVIVLGAIVATLFLIPGSPIARTATGTVAGAGAVSSIWTMIRSRVGPIARELEEPLWGAELNTAIAQAITIPPVGTPQDPEWEEAFEQVAGEVVGAAATPRATPAVAAETLRTPPPALWQTGLVSPPADPDEHEEGVPGRLPGARGGFCGLGATH